MEGIARPLDRLDRLAANSTRLGSIETDHRDWMTVFQVNFFAPIMMARGLIAPGEKPNSFLAGNQE